MHVDACDLTENCASRTRIRAVPIIFTIGHSTRSLTEFTRLLKAHGIERLIDVRTADEEVLRDAVGSWGDWLRQLANGIDDREVEPHHDPKSSGSENTFERDLTNLDEIRQEVADMARSSASWLARRELFARTVVIKVRYNDFTTITRSHTEAPTRDESSIVTRAIALLERTEAGRRPVRLLGVSVHNLCDVLTPATLSTRRAESRLPFDD